MAAKIIPEFTEEEMGIDEAIGYPKAYSKLCRSFPNLYNQGPPLAFLPYTLQPQQALRAKDLNQMFPVVDPEARPSANPRSFVNLLWKQLDHLGNAGFDPALFRVDLFGNVLYLHADSASPLAWDIDHWFPCSRGGRTVPSNLRLLQWQACKKKKDKLDFLVPWWDLQLGISVNQFLSMFASRNSDFRKRAFSFLFADGGSEELNALQTVESHCFPQHFIEVKQQIGLAPAAIVTSQRNSDASVLKPLDINVSLRNNSSFSATKKFSRSNDDNMAIERFGPDISNENDQPEADDYSTNPYLAITRARNSLRLREESKKKQEEINRLEEELSELKEKNEVERVSLQDLECVLIKRRRRVEKCRRLAEAQASYKALLEKMIRDAMHQSVVYKEQLRLNQAATSTLMARLEAQRAICDTSENELRRKFKQRDEIEKKIGPCWDEQARKRSRMDDATFEERHEGMIRGWTPLKKELRVFLQEEQKASEAGLSGAEGEEEEDIPTNFVDEARNKKGKTMILTDREMLHGHDILKRLEFREGNYSKTIESKQKLSFLQRQPEEEGNCRAMILANEETSHDDKLTTTEPTKFSFLRRQPEEDQRHRTMVNTKDEKALNCKLKELEIKDGQEEISTNNKCSSLKSPCGEHEEEYRNQVGKGNVEKWLEIMLENAKDGSPPTNPEESEDCTSEIIHKLNLVNPQKEIKYLRLKPLEEKSGCGHVKENRRNLTLEMESNTRNSFGSRKSFEVKGREEGKVGGGIASGESSRGFRSFPSSPSVILGIRRGADCMGKKPKVMDDDDDGEGNLDSVAKNGGKFARNFNRTVKRTGSK